MYTLLWLAHRCPTTTVAQLDTCAREAERDGDVASVALLRLARTGTPPPEHGGGCGDQAVTRRPQP